MAFLSAVLIVKNESSNIRACLATLDVADEIVVLDTGSSDDTMDLARQMGAQVYELPVWEGFGKARQAAIKLASHDWILSIDADERLSPELQRELRELKERAFENRAWRLKLLNYYLGKPVRFSGWQNDVHLRIFDRRYGGYNARPIHESIQTSQAIATCKHRLLHHSYPTQESHFRKIRFYGDLAGKKRYSALVAGSRAFYKFLNGFIFKLGFLDGYTGFLLALNSARGVWYKYKK